MARIRDAVKSDFEALGASMRFRMRAIAMEAEDGSVLGVGGIARLDDGRLIGFATLTDEARKNPVTLHKSTAKFLARLKREGVSYIIALADMNASPAAERWLKRLGFSLNEYDGHSVWEWKK